MSTISSNLCHIALTGSSPIIAICYAPQSERKLCRAVINKYIQYAKNVSIFYNNSASLCGCCCRWKDRESITQRRNRRCGIADDVDAANSQKSENKSNGEEIKERLRRKEGKKKKMFKVGVDCCWNRRRARQRAADTRSAAKSGATSWETDPDLERGSCCDAIVKCAAKHYAAENDFDFTWESWMLCTGRNWNWISHISVFPTGWNLNLRNA